MNPYESPTSAFEISGRPSDHWSSRKIAGLFAIPSGLACFSALGFIFSNSLLVQLPIVLALVAGLIIPFFTAYLLIPIEDRGPGNFLAISVVLIFGQAMIITATIACTWGLSYLIT